MSQLANTSTTQSRNIQRTNSPSDGRVIVERERPSADELEGAVQRAVAAQKAWKKVPLLERIEVGEKFIEAFLAASPEIEKELSEQMGRPIRYSKGEVNGVVERAKYMLSVASSALADIDVGPKEGFNRYLRREPVGVVFVIAPWNFPYMTALNSLLPALIAGNAVLLKPSAQTPLAGERFASAFAAAGLPEGVLQVLHLDRQQMQDVTAHPKVDFVVFTGSVGGGHAITKAASGGFKGLGLELGGKDPAYVRPDADIDYTVAELVDGAFFNSGQSCCGIERIYVHESLYDRFVEKFAETVKGYKLGDPLDPSTTLGPVVSSKAAADIRAQVADAVSKGAQNLTPEELFPVAKEGTAFLAPVVLVGVDHSMEVMTEETFGPVVGIMKVASDDEALALMNDSPYGLTATVWTDADKSADVVDRFVDELETGTVFVNRCDYLDPALAWTGVKDTGRGISLSKLGYDQLTRVKSVHIKLKTQ